MKLFQFIFALVFVGATYFLLSAHTAHAVAYDLIAPSGTLTRGQNVQFIVDIDSEGASISAATVGMTYQSQYLKYVSTSPGDAMTTVTATQGDTGTLLLNGSNTSGYNGSGVFAYVTFQITADAPGTAELCALFSPSVTPSPAPTSVAPTVPVPTALPVTGSVQDTQFITILGSLLVLGSSTSILLLKRQRTYSYRNKKH